MVAILISVKFSVVNKENTVATSIENVTSVPADFMSFINDTEYKCLEQQEFNEVCVFFFFFHTRRF